MNTTPPVCLRLTAQRWGTQPALRPGTRVMTEEWGSSHVSGPVGAALPQEEPSELMISRTAEEGMQGMQSIRLPVAAGKSLMCLGKSRPWVRRAGLLSQGRVLVLL